MKKCPNCDKEFPDSMRFCQTDGTPLVEVVENIQPEDPYKTVVANQQDIFNAIPPEDPFKTVVGNPIKKDDSGDLLQLPEEHDPLKTMYVSEKEIRNEMANVPTPPKEDVFEIPITPIETAPKFEEPKFEIPSEPSFTTPAPPKFNEPNLSPPSFGDAPTQITDSSQFESPFSKSSAPIEPPKFEPPTFNEPQFGSPFGASIPSPFNEDKSAKLEAPLTPLPSFKDPEPEPPKAFEQNNPFNQQSFGQNQPIQQTEWTPPPAPEASWQNQEIGQNTPFQPPVAGGGENQTLAIISLVLGIVGIVFCQITGPIALITGYMARKKATENPAEYGGSGLAMAGIITGIIGTLLLVLIVLYFILVFGLVFSQGL